jgi:hypothetical protein
MCGLKIKINCSELLEFCGGVCWVGKELLGPYLLELSGDSWLCVLCLVICSVALKVG